MVHIEEVFIAYEQPEAKKPKFNINPAISDFVFEVVDSAKSAVIVVLLLFTFVFRAVGVEGSSMVPTLKDGDWLAVTAIDYKGIERGDIVVITQPWRRNVPIIKRVIAVGGDTVDIDFVGGFVCVNDKILKEEYIKEKTHLRYDVVFPVTVPDGCVFVMGDNRNNSLDSRSGEIGFVSEDYILGKTLVRIHPLSKWKIG